MISHQPYGSCHEPLRVRSFQLNFSTFSILFIILLSISINILNTCTQHRPEITFYILRQNINYTSFGRVHWYRQTKNNTNSSSHTCTKNISLMLALPYSVKFKINKSITTRSAFSKLQRSGACPTYFALQTVHSEYASWSSYMGMLLTKCCIFQATIPVHVWDAVCSNVPYDICQCVCVGLYVIYFGNGVESVGMPSLWSASVQVSIKTM